MFVGYAAGVGKTFAMLQAAQAALGQGRDVVAGWVEPHDRPETLFHLSGIEGVAPQIVVHGGIKLYDLDLDACLKRRPEVLLVDELAHTNAPGMRHHKRWQDVDELLSLGIEVWTTLNLQHLDSMNDVVARITGVLVQETVPDTVFDRAREVEVVDVDPEDLIERLQQGKIYSPEQASRALDGFFKKDNLLALRELTLRRAADRVGREVDTARSQGGVQTIWPVRERLMVSVGPSPLSEDLIRHASRLARTLDAQLLAVFIETPSHRILEPKAQAQLEKNLAIAESLGAETVLLQGEEVARDLVAYARKRNVTKLVLGKNRDRGWKRLLRRTIGDELLRLSGDIDVYVLSGRTAPHGSPAPRARTPVAWRDLVWSTVILGLFTVLAVFFGSWGMVEANIVLTLLLSVVVAASLFGLAASIYTSFLAVLAFNFFFTKPRFSLSVDDPQYYLVFLFLLVVGTVIGTLTQRLRRGILASREREQRMEALNRMQRELASLVDAPAVIAAASRLVEEILGRPVWLLQPLSNGAWPSHPRFQTQDEGLFSWVFHQGQKAGQGTATLSSHRLAVWPLVGAKKVLGILVVEPFADKGERAAGQTELIDSLVASLASALERVELMAEAQAKALAVQAERTRNSLLHSLSHDLRTPLAVIAGSAETLAGSTAGRLSAGEADLLGTVGAEARWLGRQVENLLHLSRLTERGVPWTLVWVPAEDPAFSAVGRFRTLHPGRQVELRLPEKAPLLKMEPALIEQALFNYLENGLEYGGDQTAKEGLEVRVEVARDGVEYQVLDHGPGVPEAEKTAVFAKFMRGGAAKLGGARGTGLGLAIVQAVAQVHQGSTGVRDRSGGGAEFFLRVPIPAEAAPTSEELSP